MGVVFQIGDPHYILPIEETKRQKIPGEAAAAIATVLNDKIRFLKFTTSAAAAYQLTIKLDRQEGGNTNFASEFEFFLSLTGPGVHDEGGKPPYIVFRGKDDYSNPFFSVEAAVTAIATAVRGADHGPLVAVLKQVAMAEGGEFVPQPVGWRIARDRAEYCLDVNSRLRIWTVFPLGFDPPRDVFEGLVKETRVAGTLLSVVDPKVNEAMVPLLSTLPASEIHVEKVYVIEYRRDCTEPVSVANVGFP